MTETDDGRLLAVLHTWMRIGQMRSLLESHGA